MLLISCPRTPTTGFMIIDTAFALLSILVTDFIITIVMALSMPGFLVAAEGVQYAYIDSMKKDFSLSFEFLLLHRISSFQ